MLAALLISAVLCSAEQEKKRKYLAAVEERRASFTPFVVSVDGVGSWVMMLNT